MPPHCSSRRWTEVSCTAAVRLLRATVLLHLAFFFSSLVLLFPPDPCVAAWFGSNRNSQDSNPNPNPNSSPKPGPEAGDGEGRRSGVGGGRGASSEGRGKESGEGREGGDRPGSASRPSSGSTSGGQDERRKKKTRKGGKAAKGGCVSQSGRFADFPFPGKLPRKGPKSGRETLSFCRVYKDSTCCGRNNTDDALLSVRLLQLSSDATEHCAVLWEALECAICHPVIGVQHGPPAICKSFCDRVFAECAGAFFAGDPKLQLLRPCSPADMLCSRGTEWATSGTEFCTLAGFDVVHRPSLSDLRTCFDGSASSVIGGEAWSEGGSGSKGKGASPSAHSSSSWWQQLEEWMGVEEMGGNFWGSQVMWAVAGLVLTAAGAFLRWRSLKAKRNRAALFAARQAARATRLTRPPAAT